MYFKLAVSSMCLVLVGCGGGGGEAAAVAVAVAVAAPEPSVTVSGKVIASEYLSEAKVCIDKNRSLTCDGDEDFTLSDASGVYTLEVDYEVDALTLLAEATPDQTVGLDSGLVSSSFTLMAPAVLKNDQADNNITAFTTLISVALNDDPSMVNSEELLERIQASIKYNTGSFEPIGSDYLDSGDASSKATAELFVSNLADIQAPLDIAANEAYLVYKPSAEAGAATESAIISAIDIATQTALGQAAEAVPAGSSKGLVESSNNTKRSNEKVTDIDSEAALAVSDALGGEKVPFEPVSDWMAAGGIASVFEDDNMGKRGVDGVCRQDSDTDLAVELMTLNEANEVVTEWLYWDNDDSQWKLQCFEYQNLMVTQVLGATGWFLQPPNGGPEGPQFDSWDGNCLQESKVPDDSVFNMICVIKRDYSGESMTAVLPSEASSFSDLEAVFPENSIAYDISVSYNTARGEVFTSWNGGPMDIRTSAATAARSLEEFVVNSVEPFNDFPAYMGGGPVNLRLKSYDESTKTGEFVLYDSLGETPMTSDGMKRYRFEVRSVFGAQFMVLEKTAFDKGDFFDSNEFTAFTYITEGEIAGTPPGIYRGELREIKSPFRLNVGNPYGDIVVSVNFLDAVFDNFGLPRLPR